MGQSETAELIVLQDGDQVYALRRDQLDHFRVDGERREQALAAVGSDDDVAGFSMGGGLDVVGTADLTGSTSFPGDALDDGSTSFPGDTWDAGSSFPGDTW